MAANNGSGTIDAPLVSIVMPCLNEQEAIGSCIEKIQRTFAAANIDGEICSLRQRVRISFSNARASIRWPFAGFSGLWRPFRFNPCRTLRLPDRGLCD